MFDQGKLVVIQSKILYSVGMNTPLSNLHLSENFSFTLLNFGFPDFVSLENELFLSNTGLFGHALYRNVF
jgi:hypothetical protein